MMAILIKLLRCRLSISVLVRYSIGTIIILALYHWTKFNALTSIVQHVEYHRRPECKCYRHQLPLVDFESINNLPRNQSLLCSEYATRRGPNQRIISISLFGPKENKRFKYQESLEFLYQLINDLAEVYPDRFILRIHHDDTINYPDVICPIECRHRNVDFCNMNSKLYIPPKLWRFIPAGDPLVDTMMSRDLDSALTQRERAAVDVWLASNKSFHSMRDHPAHVVPMLGGMWGFRPSMNSAVSLMMHNKIHNPDLVKHYYGNRDQRFLSSEVWPTAKSSIIVHDSFFCKNGYGHKSESFPTQRPSANQTNCFVGCVRSCCGNGTFPFNECPMQCRPKEHPEWKYC